MTPVQYVLHGLAFVAAAVGCVLLAPLSLLALGGLGVAALIQLARNASDTFDALADA